MLLKIFLGDDMQNFIISVALVSGVGLLCGLILSLASKVFAVKRDEKAEKIRNALPGVNCGACGFAGCDSYAEALINKEGTKTNLCIPGADAVSQNIAKILGIDFEKADKFNAFIECNGNCEVTEKQFNYTGIATCAAASLLYGGDGVCSYGCIGFGDCAKVCPTDSIIIKNKIAHINPNTCIACGMCIKRCPKGIIAFRQDSKPVFVACSNKDTGALARKKCKNACIACRKCEKICPTGAITVEDNLSRIDYKKCIYCKKCAEICPTGTILVNDENNFVT